jgi:acetyl esterase/lipase
MVAVGSVEAKTGTQARLCLPMLGLSRRASFVDLAEIVLFPQTSKTAQDCKCAIRYLRANAKTYSINPNRIGVAGASAGGHLAELVATADNMAGLEGEGGWQNVSSRVQAASAYYGVSDFTVGAREFQHHAGKVVLKLFRGDEKEKPELYKQASPIKYVSKDDPPLLLVHRDHDNLVPFDQSVEMTKDYERVGLKVEFIAVKNAGHDFEQVGADPISPPVNEIHQRTIAFFKRYLGKEQAR